MEISLTLSSSNLIPKTSSSQSISSSNSLSFNDGRRRSLLLTNKNTTKSLILSRNRRGQRGFNCRSMFGLGVPELAVIAGVVALVFGPSKLPEVGKSLGKTIKSFQQAAKEFESELKKAPEPEETVLEEPVAEITTTVREEKKQETQISS